MLIRGLSVYLIKLYKLQVEYACVYQALIDEETFFLNN